MCVLYYIYMCVCVCVIMRVHFTAGACGHEWEGKRGRLPVPAVLWISAYIRWSKEV